MGSRRVNPLVLLIARLTSPEIARAVQYLKAENEILRSRLPKKVHTTPQERDRLLKLGEPLGRTVREFISVVTYRTFLRWRSDKAKGRTRKAGPGRPRKPEELRRLVAVSSEGTDAMIRIFPL